jgi:hypothetical protein
LYASKIDRITPLQSKVATNAKAPVMKVAKCFLNSFGMKLILLQFFLYNLFG